MAKITQIELEKEWARAEEAEREAMGNLDLIWQLHYRAKRPVPQCRFRSHLNSFVWDW
jgi:hypothetical protein